MMNSAVPTPFGWVLFAQNQSDPDEVVSFQTQLASLSRSIGFVRTNALEAETVGTEELVPVAVRSTR